MPATIAAITSTPTPIRSGFFDVFSGCTPLPVPPTTPEGGPAPAAVHSPDPVPVTWLERSPDPVRTSPACNPSW
jgi:hypothetical protein